MKNWWVNVLKAFIAWLTVQSLEKRLSTINPPVEIKIENRLKGERLTSTGAKREIEKILYAYVSQRHLHTCKYFQNDDALDASAVETTDTDACGGRSQLNKLGE